ncbi:MAG: IS630 transposase-related protein [Wolbachia endosymbiont of Sergentomyia squamirostris]|uniref:IS630 transposase-related protein n=1 Tax=Wolbachia endosymbiont of Sergentomyia squamirostris TaxID=3113640 RepID=A0AAT9GD00_9RICK
MTWGYSLDLRKKVIEYVNSGHSKAEVCRVFKIGKNTIFEWLKKLKNGSLERKKRENKARKLDEQKLIEYIKKHPDRIMSEIAKDFKLSKNCIWKGLKRLKITRKKRPQFTKKVMKTSVKNF